MDLREVGHIGQDQATREQDSDRKNVPNVFLSLYPEPCDYCSVANDTWYLDRGIKLAKLTVISIVSSPFISGVNSLNNLVPTA
jgi:hypothetical protein